MAEVARTGDGGAVTAPPDDLGETLRAALALAEANIARARDTLDLAVLEGRVALRGLLQSLLLTLLAGFLAIVVLVLIAAASVAALLAAGLGWAAALALAGLAWALLCAGLLSVAGRLRKDLSFPSTRKQLQSEWGAR